MPCRGSLVLLLKTACASKVISRNKRRNESKKGKRENPGEERNRHGKGESTRASMSPFVFAAM